MDLPPIVLPADTPGHALRADRVPAFAVRATTYTGFPGLLSLSAGVAWRLGLAHGTHVVVEGRGETLGLNVRWRDQLKALVGDVGLGTRIVAGPRSVVFLGGVAGWRTANWPTVGPSAAVFVDRVQWGSDHQRAALTLRLTVGAWYGVEPIVGLSLAERPQHVFPDVLLAYGLGF